MKVSVVLEKGQENGSQIMSVLEVNHIQAQLERRKFDVSANFSIYR